MLNKRNWFVFKVLLMKHICGIVLYLLCFLLVGYVHAQPTSGTDDLPLGGEYSVQQVTSQCDTRYNMTFTTRFIAEGFTYDDDGDLRIGNDQRYREFKKSDTVGVYSNTVDGGPYRTLVVLSDTLFTEEIVWGDDSPCNTLMIYSFVRSEVPDLGGFGGIPLPQSSSEIGHRYNVSTTRQDCTVYENGTFTRDNATLNFKLQDEGRLLVAQYGDIEGYSTASYYFQTNHQRLYVREYAESISVIRLISPGYFQREIYYDDGCVISDTYFLPFDVLFDDEGTTVDAFTSESNLEATPKTPNQVALINGVTFTKPDEWSVRAGSDTSRLFFFYEDEELDTNIEIRALTHDGLVFGMTQYDPNQLSLTDIMTAYYQSIPPNYSVDAVNITDFMVGELPGLRGELIAEERSNQFIVVDTGESGYVGIVINIETRAQDKWQSAIDELIASLNAENAFAGQAEFLIELSTGEVFNPDSAKLEFIDFQNFQISFSMNGTIGETAVVSIYPQLPFTSGTYQLRDVTMANQVLGALVNIPMTIDGESYMLNYTNNVEGVLNIQYDGVSLNGTFDFKANFTQFIKGYEIGVTPDTPPSFPDSITVSGSLNNVVPPPIDD